MKRGRVSILTGIWAAAAATLILAVGPAAGASAASDAYEPGQLIVRYAPGTDRSARSATLESASVGSPDALLLPRTQVVETDPGQSVVSAVRKLEADPDVLFAEPDYLMHPDAIPSDGNLDALWGLQNAGQLVNGSLGLAGADIDAVAGWDIGRTSRSTLTAVIDSGITFDHPDLAGQIWNNPGEIAGNGIDDDNNGFVDDVHGWDFNDNDNDPTDGLDHGTHVAGTIGATGNNSFAVTGVSWDASLLPLQVCRASGGCVVSSMVNAIMYSARMGAKVANISIGGTLFSQARYDALKEASSVLFVISAGNEDNDVPPTGNNEVTPKYPCQDDQAPGKQPLANIICVAATTQFDLKANYSNYGLTSVDLAAPGSNILSTFPTFSNLFFENFNSAPTRFDEVYDVPAWFSYSDRWERTDGIGNGSPGAETGAVADSLNAAGTDVNYAANSNTPMTSLPINLAGQKGCRLEFFLKLDTENPNASLSSITGADPLLLEASGDLAGPWTTLSVWAGTRPFFTPQSNSNTSLEAWSGDPTTYVRFRMVSDADGNVGKGATIDDLAVRCVSSSAALPQISFKSGTSMAAPQVAGIASIVRQLNPGLLPSAVKAKILGGVDAVPAFSPAGSTPLVTGGRANLFKTLSSLDLTAPAEPQLIAPFFLIDTPAAFFQWSGVEAGDKAQVFLDDQLIFTGIGQDSFIPVNGVSRGVHSWRVRATDPAGNFTDSQVRAFEYQPPGQAELLSVKPFGKGKGGARLKVRVSEKGGIFASASKAGKQTLLARGSKLAGSAGVTTVVIRPNRAGKKLLRNKRRLKVTALIDFRPSLGGRKAVASRRGQLAAARRGR